MLLFATPVVELGFVKAEFTGCGCNTDAFCKLQGFTAKFRRVLLTHCFWVDTGFVRNHL
ncbi:transposase [[Pantoea] beijingensis]|uniref:Transposase n=1 Tax=[Pantoea] beijingensis TaxID=1324864 RepID=A0A443IF76_9GAMM|nr:transposase [[Pantoea] beijingensis]